MEQENAMVEQEDTAQPVEQDEQTGQDSEPVAKEAETVVAEPASAPEAIVAEEKQNAAQEQDGTDEKDEAEKPSKIEDLKIGMRLEGTVRNMVEFGAFVDIGVGRDGLAHISTLKRAGIDQALKVGDTVDVQVRRVDLDNNRISLTVPGAGRSEKTALSDLEVGSTVTGRVVRLVDFGAFVDLGAQTDGLLHVSQLSGGFVRHPSEAVSVGDEVSVRILEVDMDRRRISLSMKSDEQDGPRPAERPRRAASSSGPRRGRGERRPRRAPIVMSTADDEGQNQGPTAFEVAWQEALSDRRARQGRRR
jgi:transcriptional accessory protein Tex/SPT6